MFRYQRDKIVDDSPPRDDRPLMVRYRRDTLLDKIGELSRFRVLLSLLQRKKILLLLFFNIELQISFDYIDIWMSKLNNNFLILLEKF